MTKIAHVYPKSRSLSRNRVGRAIGLLGVCVCVLGGGSFFSLDVNDIDNQYF